MLPNKQTMFLPLLFLSVAHPPQPSSPPNRAWWKKQLWFQAARPGVSGTQPRSLDVQLVACLGLVDAPTATINPTFDSLSVSGFDVEISLTQTPPSYHPSIDSLLSHLSASPVWPLAETMRSPVWIRRLALGATVWGPWTRSQGGASSQENLGRNPWNRTSN